MTKPLNDKEVFEFLRNDIETILNKIYINERFEYNADLEEVRDLLFSLYNTFIIDKNCTID